jgi:hypothetical protein
MGWLIDLAEAAIPDAGATGKGGGRPTAPHPSPTPPTRHQKVLAILARDGGQYATLVEDCNTDPVVMALATPDGTCEVLISMDRYEPFAIVAMVAGWNREEP